MVHSSLRDLFNAYTNYGTRVPTSELDGAKFVKVFKDANVLDKSTLVTTDLDIIFSKAKAKGARKLGYTDFERALEMVAEKKGIPNIELQRILLASEGPLTHATKADYVKFHDDKSTYTGVYAQGGPTNVDRSGNLSDLLDRSSADVRGVKHKQ